MTNRFYSLEKIARICQETARFCWKRGMLLWFAVASARAQLTLYKKWCISSTGLGLVKILLLEASKNGWQHVDSLKFSCNNTVSDIMLCQSQDCSKDVCYSSTCLFNLPLSNWNYIHSLHIHGMHPLENWFS